MVDNLAANLDPRPPDEVMNKQIALVRTRCEQDAWSPEAVKCLADMKNLDEANHCATLLTEAQQAALVRDQDAASGAKAAPQAEEGAMGGAAPAAAPPAPPPPAAAAPPPPAPAPATRGPKTKGAGRTEDPDQGGE